MAELDFDRGQPDDYEVEPVRPTFERATTHFMKSDEIFESTNAMRAYDMRVANHRAALARIAMTQLEASKVDAE